MLEKCEKSVKNAKICEKVRNPNAMRKLNQNSHHIASHYNSKKIRIFALLRIAFASHYHPWLVEPFIGRSTDGHQSSVATLSPWPCLFLFFYLPQTC
jgi:hypothetical protein